jgi:hypothetical protein
LSLAGCTASPSAPPGPLQFAETSAPECFRANEIYGYSRGPDGLLNIQTVGGRSFAMRLSPGCPDPSWIMQIGLRPWNSQWLCQGSFDKLSAPSPYGTGLCMVSNIEELPRSAMTG